MDQKIPDFRKYICADCSVNTLEINEYYSVHNNLWKEAIKIEPILNEKERKKNGKWTMLCIGCLEQRLGRELTCEDFRKDASVNWSNGEDEAIKNLNVKMRKEIENLVKGWAQQDVYELNVHQQYFVNLYFQSKKEGAIIPPWYKGIHNKSTRLQKRLGFIK